MTPREQPLTRRQALMILGMICGGYVGKPEAQTVFTGGGTLAIRDWNQPKSLTFDLSSYTDFRFSYNGQTVIVTPAELMEALKS